MALPRPVPARAGRLVAAPALVAALLLAGCSGDADTGDAASPTPVPPSAATGESSPTVASDRGPGVRPEDPPAVTGRVTLGSKPCGVVGGEGRVWVSLYGSGQLRWVDPETMEASEPIPVGDKPCGLALGAGSVWVENYGSGDVTRVDAATGEVQSTIQVGSAPYDVTYDSGAAWVTDYGDGTVSRIDADTEERTVVEVSERPIGIVAAAGELWVAHENGDLWAVQPQLAQVTTRLSVGTNANWTAAEGDDLWVGGRYENVVHHVDAAAGEVVGTYEIGTLPLDGDVVDGVTWFPDKAGSVHELPPDPADDGRVLDSGVGWPFVIAGHEGNIFAADFTGTDVVRLDPSAG